MSKSAITFKQTGRFTKTMKFFNHALKRDYLNILDKYGQMGVEALREATPVNSGLTADSWTYEIESNEKTCKISWYNTNTVTNKTGYEFNIAILLRYGHATRNGGWVEPNDFITPAIKPIFEDLANKAWDSIIDVKK